MYISFGYYYFYRHRDDKNNSEVLNNYADWSGCDITITTEIHVCSWVVYIVNKRTNK